MSTYILWPKKNKSYKDELHEIKAAMDQGKAQDNMISKGFQELTCKMFAENGELINGDDILT